MDVNEELGSSVGCSDQFYEEGEIINSLEAPDNDILIEYVGPSQNEEIQKYSGMFE